MCIVLAISRRCFRNDKIETTDSYFMEDFIKLVYGLAILNISVVKLSLHLKSYARLLSKQGIC